MWSGRKRDPARLHDGERADELIVDGDGRVRWRSDHAERHGLRLARGTAREDEEERENERSPHSHSMVAGGFDEMS